MRGASFLVWFYYCFKEKEFSKIEYFFGLGAGKYDEADRHELISRSEAPNEFDIEVVSL
jgi:hypothetical protein